MSLDTFLQETRKALEVQLSIAASYPRSSLLNDAIRYSLLGNGKRIRPALVRAAAALANPANTQVWLVPAMALEMIHVYSLVHDDLPAMDDDDLRHGKPSNHRQFDEATAILTGDALQAEAFALLASAPGCSAEQSRAMILVTASAAGANGMVAGQMLDLAAENSQLDLNSLEQLHSLKTGALFRAALTLGVQCQSLEQAPLVKALDVYGEALGLAFQIVDDILDVTATTEQLGKPQGSDSAANKSTYVKLLGLDGARRKAREQHDIAVSALSDIGETSQSILWQLADFVLERKR